MPIIEEKDDFKTIAIVRYWMPPCEELDWNPKPGSWSVPSGIVKQARKLGCGMLIALFPEVTDSYDGNTVTSYTEGLGLGEAGYQHIISTSIQATEAEEQNMKEYLEREWGYQIVLRKKCTYKMDQKRHEMARKFREKG